MNATDIPSPFMSIEAASKVQRRPVQVGVRYVFYSDCCECKTDTGNLIRSYSGQYVTVLRRIEKAKDEEQVGLVSVQARNGDTFDANDGELNGWIFDTGQWLGPRIN